MIYYVARILICLVSSAFLFVSYSVGGEWAVQYFGIDVWFFKLAWSLSALMLCLRALRWLNHLVMFYVKHSMIYALAQKEPVTFCGSIFGLFRRGKTYLSVVILDSILRKAMKQVYAAFTDDSSQEVKTETQAEGQTETQAETQTETQTEGQTEGQFDVLAEVRKVLAEMPNSFLFRKSKALTLTALEYIDECILAYCYANPDVRLLDATLIAFKLFFKNAIDLLKQVFKTTATHSLARILIVVTFWVVAFYYKLIAYFSFVQLVVVCYTLMMIIDISFLEPLLMKTIILNFLKYAEEAEEAEEAEKAEEETDEGEKVEGTGKKKKRKKSASKLSKEERDRIMHKLLQLSPLFKKLKSKML